MRNIDINQIPSEREEEEEECNNNIEEDEEEEEEDERSSSYPKKKLRLTKEQSFLLEETFRQNKTLNPKQKEVLAMRLKLKPRQVEVWFQNRRARSKLKQTEVECDYLKRWFNSLTEQNKRLHKEVEELRAIQLISPYNSDLQLPASSTMCPRCERVTTTTAVHHHHARAITTVAATTTPAAGINRLKMDKVN